MNSIKSFFAELTFAKVARWALIALQFILTIALYMFIVGVVEAVATFIVALILTPFGMASAAGLIVFLGFLFNRVYSKIFRLSGAIIDTLFTGVSGLFNGQGFSAFAFEFSFA